MQVCERNAVYSLQQYVREMQTILSSNEFQLLKKLMINEFICLNYLEFCQFAKRLYSGSIHPIYEIRESQL